MPRRCDTQSRAETTPTGLFTWDRIAQRFDGTGAESVGESMSPAPIVAIDVTGADSVGDSLSPAPIRSAIRCHRRRFGRRFAVSGADSVGESVRREIGDGWSSPRRLRQAAVSVMSAPPRTSGPCAQRNANRPRSRAGPVGTRVGQARSRSRRWCRRPIRGWCRATPKLVGAGRVGDLLWNGITVLELLSATSNATQLAKKMQHPGEEDRPALGPGHQVQHEVAGERQEVDAPDLAPAGVAAAEEPEEPHQRHREHDRGHARRPQRARRVDPEQQRDRDQQRVNSTPGVVGSSSLASTTNATTPTTRNAPAAAPSTCAKPGRGRVRPPAESSRQPGSCRSNGPSCRSCPPLLERFRTGSSRIGHRTRSGGAGGGRRGRSRPCATERRQVTRSFAMR